LAYPSVDCQASPDITPGHLGGQDFLPNPAKVKNQLLWHVDRNHYQNNSGPRQAQKACASAAIKIESPVAGTFNSAHALPTNPACKL
jgi:hypothetical protein